LNGEQLMYPLASASGMAGSMTCSTLRSATCGSKMQTPEASPHSILYYGTLIINRTFGLSIRHFFDK
jgi:hypothetical protein